MTVSKTEASVTLRRLAHAAVHWAVETGALPRPDSLPCGGCAATAQDYHHGNGYGPRHWLDVDALCKQCHKDQHPDARKGRPLSEYARKRGALPLPNLRAVRREKGLDQDELAGAAGIALHYIAAIEHGWATPAPSVTLRIADVLGVEPDVLLEEHTPSTKENKRK